MGVAERKAISKDIKEQKAKLKDDYLVGNKKLSNFELAMDSLLDAKVASLSIKTPFYSNLNSGMNSVYAQAKEQSKSMLLADNVDVTYQFAEVMRIMKTTIDDVIGTRTKDKTLVKNLGDVCNAQCANV